MNETFLHKNSREKFSTIIISKPNEQYNSNIVCTPTTNHACLWVILLTVITLKVSYISVVIRNHMVSGVSGKRTLFRIVKCT